MCDHLVECGALPSYRALASKYTKHYRKITICFMPILFAYKYFHRSVSPSLAGRRSAVRRLTSVAVPLLLLLLFRLSRNGAVAIDVEKRKADKKKRRAGSSANKRLCNHSARHRSFQCRRAEIHPCNQIDVVLRTLETESGLKKCSRYGSACLDNCIPPFHGNFYQENIAED